MTRFDMIGYIASGLVLGAFSMKNMVQLRIVAIASNLAFIGYGLGLDLIPVVALHAILLPMNTWRLWEVLRSDPSGSNWPAYAAMKLPITAFAGSTMKFAASIAFFAITTAVAGWLIVTGAESTAAVPEQHHSIDVKRPAATSFAALAPLW